jgi:hypothetical protein
METSISFQSDFSTYPIFLVHIGKKLVERVIVEVIIVTTVQNKLANPTLDMLRRHFGGFSEEPI